MARPISKRQDLTLSFAYLIAISNNRIIKVDEHNVYFHWKDTANNNRKKIMKLIAGRDIYPVLKFYISSIQ